MPYSKKRKPSKKTPSADSSVRSAVIGAVGIIIVALIGLAGTALTLHGESPVIVMPTVEAPNIQGTISPSVSGSGAGMNDSPSSLPGPQPGTTITLEPLRRPIPSASGWTTRSASAGPTPSLVPSPTPIPSLLISIDNTPNVLGIYIAPLILVWTADVAIGGKPVSDGCQIIWTLYKGEARIYLMQSGCNGTFRMLPRLLVGDYRLVGQVTLNYGAQTLNAVALQVGK